MNISTKLTVVALSTLTVTACLTAKQEPGGQEQKNQQLSAKASLESQGIASKALWPKDIHRVEKSKLLETRIDTLIATMSNEQKIAQMVQPEIRSMTVTDMRQYGFGSYLNGGGAFPNNNKHAKVGDWVQLAEDMYQASIDSSLDGSTIPTMWGTDAVHGHNNVIGATIFPHNIGLGAMNNPGLIHQVATATASEVAATGIDWVFAPTVAVARDDRWGRTYESYSEYPAIVSRYASEIVSGLQGEPGKDQFDSEHVISTVKHFLGDGGTVNGKDQGNNLSSEQALIDLHAQGYFSALEAGVQTVMASYNSWHGSKMHGNKSLLTGVLKDHMGFDGLVVGDWNGHGKIPNCSNNSCASAINAGVDIIMVPDDWKAFYHNTLQQLSEGTIKQERVDDAVRRILRVKLRAGLFDNPSPASRLANNDKHIIGSQAHRDIARQAVRESLVLLKNNNNLLPLMPRQQVLVTGSGADNIGMQSGGWTISWQGTGNSNDDFPGGSSIYDGIKTQVSNAGGSVELSTDASFKQKPDVAIVVFGEQPYAEYDGDISTIEHQPGNKQDLALLRALKAQDIKVVSIFLSGRPLWVNAELNQSDAFVAAWLPGSEGNGVAEVIFSKANGEANYDFVGKLPFSWPKSDDQNELNFAGAKNQTANYQALFSYGYGLNYREHVLVSNKLNEQSHLQSAASGAEHSYGLFNRRPENNLEFYLADAASPELLVTGNYATTPGSDNLVFDSVDWKKQEDTREFTWSGNASASVYLKGEQHIDLTELDLANGQLVFDVKVSSAPDAAVFLGMACGNNCAAKLDISKQLQALPVTKWQQMAIDISCFSQAGLNPGQITKPLIFESSSAAKFSIANVRIAKGGQGSNCSLSGN
ncbi:glycoside hydrolase family 3 protein [Thalassomonas haliotis]|uniref:Glycoside hydrolase family 3 protein n=1 Tax=Thalassomonas haliotis TaxID=485448 RepID=A0ABY7VGX6_9GAMM|nr:glycoside hydrolase family 3 N-terminal domain-containing protein [Thalassomonas haliotis]WDE12723.1 glycoside hydrolase family 3 protein [Thalassomonas haliotis]